MEGALGTVVAGLVENPVIAVPTSVGYGASFHGLSALITMINSCANGISVVNIDNGYGAAYLAAQINRLAVRDNRCMRAEKRECIKREKTGRRSKKWMRKSYIWIVRLESVEI